MTSSQGVKRCAGCDALIKDDSYKVIKNKIENADGWEQLHEALMCMNCIENIEWVKEYVISNIEPNENGDYEWGSITVRK